MKETKRIYKIASLFSGCGGLDLGFIGGFDYLGRHFSKNSVKIVFANDFDRDATTCYNSNLFFNHDGDCKCLLADIRNVLANDVPDYDILLISVSAIFKCR